MNRRIRVVSLLFLIISIAGLSTGSTPVSAQNGPVQEFTDRIEPGTTVYYIVPNLKQGQTLYVRAEAASGNLDPFVGLLEVGLDRETIGAGLKSSLQQMIKDGVQPMVAYQELLDGLFLDWNDDGPVGSAAVLSYPIPADGDYQLLVADSPAQETFGDYRILIGVDNPKVATGEARPTSDLIAVFDARTPEMTVVTDEIIAELTADKGSASYTLRELAQGDTVYVSVEVTSGDLRPIITLENYRGKTLATGNYLGQAASAQLGYTFPLESSQARVRITACCDDGSMTTGEYRLLIGVNAPEVLSGNVRATDQPAVISPIVVKAGIRMDQITGVDQVAENYGVVANIRMEWTDPALAFDPDECQCYFRTFTESGFIDYLSHRGITSWPVTTVYNQQGRRDSQGDLAVVGSDGRAAVVSRFSTTLQAPDFNFRLFPFDEQQFYIRLRFLFPEDSFLFSDLEGFSGLGAQLGEEEWVVTGFETTVDMLDNRSRFNFGFTAERHLDFYLYRVFLPLAIIVIVSWVLFFLKDYQKRVDAAAANLLLLIAFNFTISGDLPRLGYLTLMDAILVTAFVVTSSVLLFNVYLRRLEVSDRRDRAERLDKFVITYYPIAYVAFTALVVFYFFRVA